jgi:hypothetical protein
MHVLENPVILTDISDEHQKVTEQSAVLQAGEWASVR